MKVPGHLEAACPTGPGTSTARPAHPDTDPTPPDAEDGGPRFRIPWPARLNPEVERMRRRSLQWAASFGIVTGEQEIRRLDEPRFDLLTGYAFPDARGLGAQLASDWMYWFFPFDDWFDGPLGEDPALARTVLDPMIRFAYGEAGALPISAPPLVRAYADLCAQPHGHVAHLADQVRSRPAHRVVP
ncbi:hypothetical protein [Herbidospora mongoliensis]|uniref:hypothetical protein n=1 Tax=Herbidospora mongoliensis TaxID=688067 RepID=UPI0008368892|nr:hypothetical protein [Herbidospora mongoliensis]